MTDVAHHTDRVVSSPRHEEVTDASGASIEAGLTFSGRDESGARAEVIELDPARFDHPFYFGLQGHPEYKSRPLAPSPPFLAFVRAAAGLPAQYPDLAQSA